MSETPQNSYWHAVVAWILAIAALLILVVRYAEPLLSLDIWFHILLGEQALATGQLIPDHSVYTWTAATSYAVYNTWLSDVLLYLVYDLAGVPGLIALRYIAYGAFFAMAAHFAFRRGVASNPIAWLIIALGILLAFSANHIKPELFSFFFMVTTVWLYYVIRTSGTKAWRLCYLFPLIVVLWVNSHGAFVISSLFFATIVLGEVLNMLTSPRYALPAGVRIHFFVALLLCIPALFINPFGYELPMITLEHVFRAAKWYDLASLVPAYLPTASFNGPPFYSIQYLTLAAIIFVFLVWQWLKQRQLDWVPILTFIAYAFMYAQFIRSAYFLAPVFVLSGLYLLSMKRDSWAWPKSRFHTALLVACCGVLMLGLAARTLHGAVCYSYGGASWFGFGVANLVPVAETRFIKQQQPDISRIGNTYSFGSYLMHSLWPERSAMIDSRYFPFRDQLWFQDYLRFLQGEGIAEFVTAHPADIWLIAHDNSRQIEWFHESPDWASLFVGPVGVVFGPAKDAPPQPRIFDDLDRVRGRLTVTSLIRTAIEFKNWELAGRVREAAARNLPATCRANRTLLGEIENTVTGWRAFYDGNYDIAATCLSQETKFFRNREGAVASHTALALQASAAGDFKNARQHAVAALLEQPRDTVSVYNAMVADWQYRQSGLPLDAVTDDLTWSFLSGVLLENAEVPPQHAEMIDVAKALRDGSVTETPTMIER